MSFRDIQTSKDVENYHNRLIQGYPDRPAVVNHIIDLIQQSDFHNLNLLELCIGPGQLAKALCTSFPNINYIGLDFMQPFLDYTAKNLPIEANATFICADLTLDNWVEQITQKGIQPFDVIVSMQSLHDVGGQERAEKIYQHSFRLLGENGLFINADLITQVGEEANARPGRLTVPMHQKLLLNSGFKAIDCSFTNQFGICHGIK
ncbi:MAG: trans-aconitate 2-methyltransferase [Anaerolineae bacterium]